MTEEPFGVERAETGADRPGAAGALHPMSRREFLIAAAAAGLSIGAASSLLAACGSTGGSSGQQASSPAVRMGGNLIFARGSDPRSLDPSPAEENEDIWTSLLLYDCLYAVKPDGKGSQPWLATSYELSSDQRTWTFQLRPGVKFSDGRPLNSEDVVFSLNRARKGLNGYIDEAITDVAAAGPSTVKIQTKQPWGPLLGDLSLYSNAILPNNLNGMNEKQFFANPVGTGPFMLDHWTKGQELKIVKNPHYWQAGKPLLDSVLFTTVPEDNTRLLQLRGNQAHIIEFPPFSALKSLKSAPGIVVHLFPATWVSYLGMNEERPQFADVHVRRACAYGVDRKSIIDSVLFGNGQEANSFFSPSWAFYNPDTPYMSYDVSKAKQELAQSAFPNGFSTDMIVTSGDTVNSAIAQIVQSNLKDIGIDISIKQYDPSTFTDLQEKQQYGIYPNYYTLDIGDPDENVPWCVQPVRGGANSLNTGYKDPDVEKWANEAARTIEPEKRRQLYAEIQNRVTEDAAFVELYYSPYVYANRDSVQGFTVYPTGNYHLENVWLSS